MSKLFVDEIVHQSSQGSGTITLGASGETVAMASGASVGAGMGKILQVVHATSETGIATTSTSYQDIVTVNITPSSTSNKIYIATSVQIRKDSSAVGNQSAGLRLLRDSTALTTISNYASWNNNVVTRTQETVGYNHLDSPSSTSQITYKLQGRAMVSGGQVSFNHDSSKCFITAMEIAG